MLWSVYVFWQYLVVVQQKIASESLLEIFFVETGMRCSAVDALFSSAALAKSRGGISDAFRIP